MGRLGDRCRLEGEEVNAGGEHDCINIPAKAVAIGSEKWADG